jgi:AcrR family transcriptional regulator
MAADATKCRNLRCVARWQPDARERLQLAALDLFAERGYEHTTVTEIAERAGLTKSTFFRHFPDKREVLSGGNTVHGLLFEAIAAAPPNATPLEAIAGALDVAGRKLFVPARREFVTRRRAVVAASAELQEREALKGLALLASITDALRERGVADVTAQMAAQMGALALKLAFDRWLDPDNVAEFGHLAREALAELRTATAAVSHGGPISMAPQV